MSFVCSATRSLHWNRKSGQRIIRHSRKAINVEESGPKSFLIIHDVHGNSCYTNRAITLFQILNEAIKVNIKQRTTTNQFTSSFKISKAISSVFFTGEFRLCLRALDGSIDENRKSDSFVVVKEQTQGLNKTYFLGKWFSCYLYHQESNPDISKC